MARIIAETRPSNATQSTLNEIQNVLLQLNCDFNHNLLLIFFLQLIPHGGEGFTSQRGHGAPERRGCMGFNFAQELAAPRQNILSEKGFQNVAFIFRRVIFQPRSGQQQGA